MLVMTARVDRKKIIIIAAAVIFLIAGIFLLAGRGGKSESTAAPGLSANDGRVGFLKECGWEVTVSPTETSQVRIPSKASAVFDRYNDLQKSQGYDLKNYAGKTVMRYVYKVSNYPGATEPVYATLLIYKNQIIGGDITDTSATGVICGLKKAGQTPDSAPTQAPSESTKPPQAA